MKTILISGGSDGLGKALATQFSKKYEVIILSHNKEKTSKAAKEIGCDFVVADVSDYKSVEKAVATVLKKYKTIDCLINNAGVWIEGPLEKNDPKEIARVINVNTTGTIFLAKA